jgi:Raf kinase inhibitor-like YbhB/YbcL family protein
MALVVAVAGCGGPAATDRTRDTETEMPSFDFQLSSTAFSPGGSIPARFTCDGEDISPDLAWTGAPPGTAAFLLVVDDLDARSFAHWIVYDLTGSETGALPPGVSASPDAPPQGTNDFGQVGWGGPCPPSGEHRYRFTLTALVAPLGLEGAPRKSIVDAALAAATVLGTATLDASYRRGS